MFDAHTIAGHRATLDTPPPLNPTAVNIEIVHWPARPNQPSRLSLYLSNTDAAALGQALIERSAHNRKGSRRIVNLTRADGVN